MARQPAGGDSQDSAFDHATLSALRDLEDGHPWFVARNKLIAWALDRHGADARSFLDVGCGTGFVMAGLHRHRPHLALTGVEPTAEALQYAALKVPQARLVVASARDLAATGTFDAVGAFDVLEHLADDVGALGALRHAVRPGGILILTVPQHPWLWSPLDAASGHHRRYTRRSLHEALRQGGWNRVELMTSFVSLPIVAMTLSRLLQRRSRDIDVFKDLRASRRARWFLNPIFTIERFAIRSGVRLPVGGSLLVVARRS